MLDVKIPATSKRNYSSDRLLYADHPIRLKNGRQGRFSAAAQPSEETYRSPKTVTYRRTSIISDRLTKSETRLIFLASIITAIVCGLLIVYLAAYAQVANLGIAQARARVKLKTLRAQGETLRAEGARSANPDQIAIKAKDMGMVLQRPNVCYVYSQSSSLVGKTNTNTTQYDLNNRRLASNGTDTNTTTNTKGTY